MNLWTWQSPDFSLLDGHVEPTKSPYADTVSTAPDAYRKLARCLSTDQIIWCHTLPGQHIRIPGFSMVEWVLDVPPEEIMGFTDSLVWNRILGIKCGLPRSWHFKWRQAARELHPHDPDKWDEYEKAQEAEFWERPPPDGGWWKALCVDGRADENVVALVRHPLKPEWVLKQQHWS
ncbi:MAG: hypothetical protein KA354_23075 [Phycisphaerae bacterium]|nr:hypothetical protein [Phycisphaerae bacterium]